MLQVDQTCYSREHSGSGLVQPRHADSFILVDFEKIVSLLTHGEFFFVICFCLFFEKHDRYAVVSIMDY